MVKQVKTATTNTKRVVQTVFINLAIFLFGASLAYCGFAGIKYADHYQGLAHKLGFSAGVLITVVGLYALGKWFANKELEIK